MIVVRTMQSPDGILGLNGWWYLEDDNKALLRFCKVEEAKDFVEEGGEDPDNQWIEYREEDSIQDDLREKGYLDIVGKVKPYADYVREDLNQGNDYV